MLAGCMHANASRSYIRGLRAWPVEHYCGDAARVLKVARNRGQSGDASDSGTMIVLFLLAATAILGVVQTYMMIRARRGRGPSGLQEYRQVRQL